MKVAAKVTSDKSNFANKNGYFSETIRTGLNAGNAGDFLSELFIYHNGLLESEEKSRWDSVSFVAPQSGKHGMQSDYHIAGDCSVLLSAVKNFQEKTNISYYFIGTDKDLI